MDIHSSIEVLARELVPELSRQRRDFHKYAEPGWMEMRTASIIIRRLRDLGYEVLTGAQVCKKDARMGVPSDEELDRAYERAAQQGADPDTLPETRGGMTGVIGILRCGEGPVVALRFDMDALGVHESKDGDHRPAAEGFASVNPGVMHACGHDGHICAGLGVAQVLMDIRQHLHGTVKLIFQPAEEGVRGAKSIVEMGHLDDVDCFFGCHVTQSAGDVQITPGSDGALATCKYDVIFRGQAAHAGGEPEQGKNALMAAATAVLNLYAIPRHSGGATRINVGRLQAGSGRNVIADEAVMELEVRGETTQLNTYMQEQSLQIVNAAAAMHGCTVQIRQMGAAELLTCDEQLMELIARLCAEKLGMQVSQARYADLGGSEDVSYMMNRVQSHGGKATFFRIHTPVAGAFHDRNFDFDEDCIPQSVRVFCSAVYELLK